MASSNASDSPRRNRQEHNRRARRVLGLVWGVAIVCCALPACQKSLYQDYRIPTVSMEPTFAQHQRVHVRRIASGASLARGDVIVFRQPGDPAKKYMKRIVGLAGDHIEIATDTLWVNGEVQHETYVQYTRPVPRFGPRIVPPETVFVLGDNRTHSFDSRNFGCVPRDHIVGLVTR